MATIHLTQERSAFVLSGNHYNERITVLLPMRYAPDEIDCCERAGNMMRFRDYKIILAEGADIQCCVFDRFYTDVEEPELRIEKIE